jgi:ribonuclease HI
MNNEAERRGLTRGIQIAIKNNFTKLFVEGDSLIIINPLRKIINEANPDKISPSWRLLHGLQTIVDSLHPGLTIIPTHVRR